MRAFLLALSALALCVSLGLAILLAFEVKSLQLTVEVTQSKTGIIERFLTR